MLVSPDKRRPLELGLGMMDKAGMKNYRYTLR